MKACLRSFKIINFLSVEPQTDFTAKILQPVVLWCSMVGSKSEQFQFPTAVSQPEHLSFLTKKTFKRSDLNI